MPQLTHTFDLARLRLQSGEGRRLDLQVRLPELSFGGEPYAVEPADVPLVLDVSRTTAQGYALRLRFEARLSGPCMRCLDAADPVFAVDAREVELPGQGEELESPYVHDQVLDVEAWARDALALALPAQIVCTEDCAGLCSVCGENLNDAGPEHHHEPAPDARWAKLRELRLE
jgi:uncharacterized protein